MQFVIKVVYCVTTCDYKLIRQLVNQLVDQLVNQLIRQLFGQLFCCLVMQAGIVRQLLADVDQRPKAGFLGFLSIPGLIYLSKRGMDSSVYCWLVVHICDQCAISTRAFQPYTSPGIEWRNTQPNELKEVNCKGRKIAKGELQKALRPATSGSNG